MNENGIFRRRHLPHWDMEGKPFFVTACLEGSLAAAGLARIRQYRAELEARPRPDHMSEADWDLHQEKLVFALVDDLLDHHSPVRHLTDERQAGIVQEALLHFANERYSLLAFVVMPSHHHWLFLPNEKWVRESVQRSAKSNGRQRTPREIISHSIQSYTPTMCNRVRGKSGPYWQTETFDHWARDEAETYRIIDYIERNPVRAGLVANPEEWKWSSARIRSIAGTMPGDPIVKVG